MTRAHANLSAWGAASLAAFLLAMGCSTDESSPTGAAIADVTDLALAERDLAVAFALEDTSAPPASTSLGPGAVLLPQPRYGEIARAFRDTNVGDALDGESRYDDWRLLSFRVVPCSPLGPAPVGDTAALCWPEVRLVLQPVLRDVRIHERTSPAYADDRGIHALYDAPPEAVLPGSEAAEARRLVQKVRDAAKAWKGGVFAPLDASELAELRTANAAVARDMLLRAKGLRDATLPSSAFAGHGVRPESADGGARATAFAGRVTSFLARYAQPGALREMTAFSLPEGREPAHSDEWVFLSFKGGGGDTLLRERIAMKSALDGRVLVDLGLAPRASQIQDDESVQAASSDPSVANEIAARAMLGSADISRLTPTIRDRQTTFVPNTTCGSCHKMNALRFDFHSFGYLEDRELTISPRVVTDVALDLGWVKARLRTP